MIFRGFFATGDLPELQENNSRIKRVRKSSATTSMPVVCLRCNGKTLSMQRRALDLFAGIERRTVAVLLCPISLVSPAAPWCRKYHLQPHGIRCFR